MIDFDYNSGKMNQHFDNNKKNANVWGRRLQYSYFCLGNGANLAVFLCLKAGWEVCTTLRAK